MQVLTGCSVPVPEGRVGAQVRGPHLIPHLQDALYSISSAAPAPAKHTETSRKATQITYAHMDSDKNTATHIHT